MWRTYTGANPLSTRNFNPGRTTVLSGAAGAAQTQTSSATWLSNLGAAMSSLDKMNYEPSGVPANQHIYAANVRPVDALPRGRDSDGVWRLLSATAAERRSLFQPVGDAK